MAFCGWIQSHLDCIYSKKDKIMDKLIRFGSRSRGKGK